jgi:plastocyanin
VRYHPERRRDLPPGRGARRRAPLAGGAIAAIGAALFLISGCETAPSQARAAHRVAIRAMRYEPAVLRGAPGDTVRWTNLDLVPHDLVPHTVTSLSREFDSGNLPPDSSWALVLGHSAVLDYSCLFHPGMKGSVVAAP